MIKTPLQTVILVFLVLVGASSACLAQELTTEVRPSWWTSLPTTPLFTAPAGGGELPAGWSVIGGPAKFEFVNDAKGRLELRGTGSAPRNAFLTSPNSYGDFLLEFEVFMEKDGGNSGVQIRSTVDGSRMFGYQIEIDPSDRAWSAGLYDEGRRGWLASLEDNEDAQEAFAPGAWNHYRILAIGPRIRTWINDVPAVDHLDFVDSRGRLGFQVHSGRCDVRWRNIRIADLGERTDVKLLDASQRSGFREIPEGGVASLDGGWVMDQEGVRLESLEPIQDVPTVLTIKSTIREGLLFIEMGDLVQGPGYRLKIPGPLGSSEKPGVIRILRFPDQLRVLVDDVPLVPGPPDIGGDFPLSISCSIDTDVTIHEVSINLPSSTESMWFKKIRESKQTPVDVPKGGSTDEHVSELDP